MKNQNATSIRKVARTAGLLNLLQIPLGVFGIMYVPEKIVVQANIEATLQNISDNEMLFRLSIVSAILAAIVTVFTAISLYKVLSQVSRIPAKLMVIFTIIVAPITIMNELNHIAAFILSESPERLATFSGAQQETIFSVLFDLHKSGIQIASLFWGLWLLPMGYLVYRSTYIPKMIGALLIIGGLGYLVDVADYFLGLHIGVVVSQFTFIGEVLMVLWLLIKGINVDNFQKRFNTK